MHRTSTAATAASCILFTFFATRPASTTATAATAKPIPCRRIVVKRPKVYLSASDSLQPLAGDFVGESAVYDDQPAGGDAPPVTLQKLLQTRPDAEIHPQKVNQPQASGKGGGGRGGGGTLLGRSVPRVLDVVTARNDTDNNNNNNRFSAAKKMSKKIKNIPASLPTQKKAKGKT